MKGMLNSFHLSYQTSSETVTFDFNFGYVHFIASGEYSADSHSLFFKHFHL
jgi:hypothetical protein